LRLQQISIRWYATNEITLAWIYQICPSSGKCAPMYINLANPNAYDIATACSAGRTGNNHQMVVPMIGSSATSPNACVYR
jgi:hypothetical protein